MVDSAVRRADLLNGKIRRVAAARPGNGPRALGAASAAIALLLAANVIDPSPRLVWNVSRSAPRGLYLVTPGAVPRVGDQVAARMSVEMGQLAAQRRYLPLGVPLIKGVAAVQGDEICAIGARILVNMREVARRLDSDPSGRSMPWWWTGCRRLGAGELLLLNPSPHSFDGRYTGPTDPSLLIGKARLLWRR